MYREKRLVAASILSANFAYIHSEIQRAEEAGCDWIHLDIMDGAFVPPITFGAQMAKAIRTITSLPLDTHLMVRNPSSHLNTFIDAGINRLTFHIETEPHAHRLLSAIKEAGIQTGIAITPSTPVSSITEILPLVDQVLVMTVNPGYGGQKLIPATLEKVKTLVQMRNEGAGEYLIVIDGGFGKQTARQAWDSGIDVAVMGSAFFSDKNPKEALNTCRNAGLSSSL